MDSETTFPAESQNSIVKEKLGASGKMDIHKGIKKLKTLIGQSKALCLLNQANMASKSPTKDIIIQKKSSNCRQQL